MWSVCGQEEADLLPVEQLETAVWFVCLQTPFTLTLRLWDIFILEGEKLLTSMAYTILKIHRSKEVFTNMKINLYSSKIKDIIICPTGISP